MRFGSIADFVHRLAIGSTTFVAPHSQVASLDDRFSHADTIASPNILGNNSFDLRRCSHHGLLRVFVYPDTVTGSLRVQGPYHWKWPPGDLGTWVDRAANGSSAVVKRVWRAEEACLLLAGALSFSSPQALRQAPSWNGGANHFLWQINYWVHSEPWQSVNHPDRPLPGTSLGVAAVSSTALLSTAMSAEMARTSPTRENRHHQYTHRPGYDVPTTLRPLATTVQITRHERSRALLLSFRGALDGPGPRTWWLHRQATLAWGHEPGVAVNYTKGGGDANAHMHLLADSTFFFAPGGGGAHSYRLAEGLAAGSIPVLTEGMLLPFEPEISWDACAVRVAPSELSTLPARLRRQSADEVRRRRHACHALSHATIGEGLSDERPFQFALGLWARRVRAAQKKASGAIVADSRVLGKLNK